MEPFSKILYSSWATFKAWKSRILNQKTWLPISQCVWNNCNTNSDAILFPLFLFPSFPLRKACWATLLPSSRIARGGYIGPPTREGRVPWKPGFKRLACFSTQIPTTRNWALWFEPGASSWRREAHAISFRGDSQILCDWCKGQSPSLTVNNFLVGAFIDT